MLANPRGCFPTKTKCVDRHAVAAVVALWRSYTMTITCDEDFVGAAHSGSHACCIHETGALFAGGWSHDSGRGMQHLRVVSVWRHGLGLAIWTKQSGIPTGPMTAYPARRSAMPILMIQSLTCHPSSIQLPSLTSKLHNENQRAEDYEFNTAHRQPRTSGTAHNFVIF